MILFYMSFFSLMVYAIEDYSSLFTAAMIQELQVPINILNDIQRNTGTFINVNVQKFDGFYVKKNISRLTGVQRVQYSINNRSIQTYMVPTKFLLPVFNLRGDTLNESKSRVVSMHIDNTLTKELTMQEVLDILQIVEDTQLFDMNCENLRRSSSGKLVLIDTELLFDNLSTHFAHLFALSCLKRYKMSAETGKMITDKEMGSIMKCS